MKAIRVVLIGLIIAALFLTNRQTTKAQGSNIWFPQSGICSTCVSTTWTFSNQAGDVAQISWYGTEVKIQGADIGNGGFVDVSVDGNLPFSTVDTFFGGGGAPNIVFWLDSGTLPEANHTATVYVTGTHDGSATDSYVAIDGAYVIDGASSTFIDDHTTGTGFNQWNYTHWDHFPTWSALFDFIPCRTYTWQTLPLGDFAGTYYDCSHGYWVSADSNVGMTAISGVAATGPTPPVNVASGSGITDVWLIGNNTNRTNIGETVQIIGNGGSTLYNDPEVQPAIGVINIYHHFFGVDGPITNLYGYFDIQDNSSGGIFTIYSIQYNGYGTDPFLPFDNSTPTPTNSPTPFNTATPTPTPTSTNTATNTATFTPSLTPTDTLTPSLTPTNTALAPPPFPTPTIGVYNPAASPGAANCGLYSFCNFQSTPSPYPTYPATPWVQINHSQEIGMANGAINTYKAVDGQYHWIELISFIVLVTGFILRVTWVIRNRVNRGSRSRHAAT